MEKIMNSSKPFEITSAGELVQNNYRVEGISSSHTKRTLRNYAKSNSDKCYLTIISEMNDMIPGRFHEALNVISEVEMCSLSDFAWDMDIRSTHFLDMVQERIDIPTWVIAFLEKKYNLNPAYLYEQDCESIFKTEEEDYV